MATSKKINYPVLYESGITPPLCEVSAPEPDAGGKRIVAYVYKSSRNTVFENPDIVKTCTVRDLKNDFVNCDEKGEGQCNRFLYLFLCWGPYYFPAVPEPVRNLSVTPPHPIPV